MEAKTFEIPEENVAVKSVVLAHVLEVGEFMGCMFRSCSFLLYSSPILKMSESWKLYFSYSLASMFSIKFLPKEVLKKDLENRKQGKTIIPGE